MRNIALYLAAAFMACATAFVQASDLNVGVSIAGEVTPGVYGRVDIGNRPPPVLYAQPVIIARQARPITPVYMHVPPGHAKNWSKHCHKYSACAQPVYFVKSAEYQPGHKGGKGEKKDKHHKEKKHKHDHD